MVFYMHPPLIQARKLCEAGTFATPILQTEDHAERG